jgi:cysteinyl-tRNA synthetase
MLVAVHQCKCSQKWLNVFCHNKKFQIKQAKKKKSFGSDIKVLDPFGVDTSTG